MSQHIVREKKSINNLLYIHQVIAELCRLKPNKSAFVFICFVLSLFNIGNAYSALTATTAQFIQGTGPYLIAEGGVIPNDENDLLNFTIPTTGVNKITYFGNTALPIATLTTGFSNNLMIADFKIMDANSFRDDAGGELLDITGHTHNWKDRFGVVPDNSERLDPCRAPYELNIEATTLVVSSIYGTPSSKTYQNLQKTFSIDVQYDTPICYVKPVNLTWIASNTSGSSVINAGGYGGGYSADFNPLWGFKTDAIASSGKSWPTTAFPSASFELISRELGDTNDYYTFDVLGGTPSPLTVTNNQFTFKTTKPTSTITIQATHKITGDVFNYSFTVEKWAAPGGTYKGSYTNVNTKCSGNLFSVDEFSNAPISAGASARFSRAIDGTLQGEWGRLTQYQNTDWVFWPSSGGSYDGFYWTKSQVPSSSRHYVAFADNGAIRGDYSNSANYFQACKL